MSNLVNRVKTLEKKARKGEEKMIVLGCVVTDRHEEDLAEIEKEFYEKYPECLDENTLTVFVFKAFGAKKRSWEIISESS